MCCLTESARRCARLTQRPSWLSACTTRQRSCVMSGAPRGIKQHASHASEQPRDSKQPARCQRWSCNQQSRTRARAVARRDIRSLLRLHVTGVAKENSVAARFPHNRREFPEFPGECPHSPAKRNISRACYVAWSGAALAFWRGCVAMQTQPFKVTQKLGSLCCVARSCVCVMARVRCNADTALQSTTKHGYAMLHSQRI